METTFVITLSYHVDYEGFSRPETFIFKQTHKESVEGFVLRMFISIIQHPYYKSVLSSGDWCDIQLFVSLNADIAQYQQQHWREMLFKHFIASEVTLSGNCIH